MHDRDQKFYVSLFFSLLFLLILIRLFVKFVGIDIEIPYVDDFLKLLFDVAASIASTISKSFGNWSNG